MGQPVMRVFRALQLALVVGWVGLAFKWWWLAGLMTPAVVALGAWRLASGSGSRPSAM